MGNGSFPRGIPGPGVGERQGGREREERWKKYVLADILAVRWEESKRRLEESDLRWLPMLLVVGRENFLLFSPLPIVGFRVSIGM